MTNKLFIPNEELILHGCKNCILKANSMCPYLLGEDIKDATLFNTKLEIHSEGICDRMTKFIFQFAEGEDSITAVWEKLYIFIHRMQMLSDYTEYKKLEKEYNELVADGGSYEDIKELGIKKEQMKIWWSKLSEGVIKEISKVVDRESRNTNTDKLIQKIPLNQIHQLAAEAKKRIE